MSSLLSCDETDDGIFYNNFRLSSCIYIVMSERAQCSGVNQVRHAETKRKHYSRKIHEGQEYAPRLEPAAPIRLADGNHAHYPSRRRTILIKRWLDDGPLVLRTSTLTTELSRRSRQLR